PSDRVSEEPPVGLQRLDDVGPFLLQVVRRRGGVCVSHALISYGPVMVKHHDVPPERTVRDLAGGVTPDHSARVEGRAVSSAAFVRSGRRPASSPTGWPAPVAPPAAELDDGWRGVDLSGPTSAPGGAGCRGVQGGELS